MIKGFDGDRFHEKFVDHGACGVAFEYFFAEPGAQDNRNILPKILDIAGQNISGHVGHCHIGNHQVKGPGIVFRYHRQEGMIIPPVKLRRNGRDLVNVGKLD